jgi:hypothetical protein
MDVNTVLQTPVNQLGLPADFCRQAKHMGFDTIADVLKLSPAEIIGKHGFTYTWLGELSAYLSSKGLLHLLQPLPGKTSG